MSFTDDYYRQYIYVEHDKSFEADYRRKLDILGFKNNAYVRDLSMLPPKAQKKIISEIMIAEKHRGSESSEAMYINILQMGRDTLTIILSINELYLINNLATVEHITTALKGHKALAAPEKEKYLGANTLTAKYKKLGNSSVRGYDAVEENKIHRVECENYKLSDKVSQRINEILSVSEDEAEAFIYAAYGKTLCAFLNISNALFMNERDDTFLFGGVVSYDSTASIKDATRAIRDQIVEIKSTAINPEKMYEAIYSNEDSIASSVYFFYDGMYDRFIDAVDSNFVYTLPSFVKDKGILDVEFGMRDGVLSVQYTMPTLLSVPFSLDVFHSAFEMVIEAMVDGKELNAKNVASETNAESSDTKTDNSKGGETRAERTAISWISTHPTFAGVSRDEIKELLKDNVIIYRRGQQNILEPGRTSSRVFFVGNGKIEALMRSSDGYYNPLQILKVGDVFSIESLVGATENKILYRVNSSEALLFALDSKKLISLGSKYPSVWQSLMGIQCESLMRLQKLWINA